MPSAKNDWNKEFSWNTGAGGPLSNKKTTNKELLKRIIAFSLTIIIAGYLWTMALNNGLIPENLKIVGSVIFIFVIIYASAIIFDYAP